MIPLAPACQRQARTLSRTNNDLTVASTIAFATAALDAEAISRRAAQVVG